MIADMVAENSSVCRAGLHAPKITFISVANAAPSSRSASSSTTTFSRDRSTALLLERMWSTSRPGVDTTTCDRRASDRACSVMLTQPTNTYTRAPSGAPNARNWSAIWYATSRVGASDPDPVPLLVCTATRPDRASGTS